MLLTSNCFFAAGMSNDDCSDFGLREAKTFTSLHARDPGYHFSEAFESMVKSMKALIKSKACPKSAEKKAKKDFCQKLCWYDQCPSGCASKCSSFKDSPGVAHCLQKRKDKVASSYKKKAYKSSW